MSEVSLGAKPPKIETTLRAAGPLPPSTLNLSHAVPGRGSLGGGAGGYGERLSRRTASVESLSAFTAADAPSSLRLKHQASAAGQKHVAFALAYPDDDVDLKVHLPPDLLQPRRERA